MVNEKLIEAIREKMAEKGLNQKQTAQLIGISESRLSDILNGKRGINYEQTCRLYHKLHIDAGILLDDAICEVSPIDRYRKISAMGFPNHVRIYNEPIPSEQVQNKNTPFYGQKKTVIAGWFKSFPSEDILHERLIALGADMLPSWYDDYDILVAGDDVSGMIKKAEEKGIRVIREDELLKYVESPLLKNLEIMKKGQ